MPSAVNVQLVSHNSHRRVICPHKTVPVYYWAQLPTVQCPPYMTAIRTQYCIQYL